MKKLTETQKATIIIEYFQEFINIYYKEVFINDEQNSPFLRKVARCLDIPYRIVQIWFSRTNVHMIHGKNKRKIDSFFKLDSWIWEDKEYDINRFRNKIKEYHIR